jgi:RNA polymerase sigma factor (sigma-70 family)
MQDQMVTTPARPSRAQIEPAALELLSRHSAGLLATARRYSATPEDAEDAYQRGVEILLTKAPSTTEDELLPWLKTVVKHEAFAVRKSGARAVLSDQPIVYEQDEHAWTDERAERYERLRVGAEAMAALKPQEIRCLLLKAEGLSYREICDVTGFSYTKVNRCITEGRRAFLSRVAGIETGAECERLAPLISKVADGEATRDEMRLVRPHLKSCLACKATLREYRAAPARLAGLVPPVVAIGGGAGPGFLGRLLGRFSGEVAGAKLASVAASAVVLAGGGAVAGVDALHHDPPAVAPAAFAERASGAAGASPARATTSRAPGSIAPDPSRSAIVQAIADHASSDAGRPTSASPAPQRSDPIAEFDPGESASGESAAGESQQTAASPLGGSEPPASAPSRAGRLDSQAGSGTGEFGP